VLLESIVITQNAVCRAIRQRRKTMNADMQDKILLGLVKLDRENFFKDICKLVFKHKMTRKLRKACLTDQVMCGLVDAITDAMVGSLFDMLKVSTYESCPFPAFRDSKGCSECTNGGCKLDQAEEEFRAKCYNPEFRMNIGCYLCPNEKCTGRKATYDGEER
jgi:hypothetical protein